MILEIILLRELLQTGLSGSKFAIPFRKEKETVIVLPVEPKQPAVVGKSFAEALQDLTYPEGWDAQNIVVTLDPKQVEIYQESERVKKALRGL